MLGSDSEQGKVARISYLPWENLESKELETLVKKGVFSLSKEYDILTKPKSALEFEFDFDMEAYAFISIALMKYDMNLTETRSRLVPDEVSEEEFWCNYFYAIEYLKAEHGLPTRLGVKIDEAERSRMLEEELKRLEEPTAKRE